MQLAPVLLSLLAAAPSAFQEDRMARLIEKLGADFLEEREEARKELEKAGSAAEGSLIKALDSADYRVRKTCVELLTIFKSAKAVGRAAELLRSDEDASVRDAAFSFLCAQGRDAEDPLIGALDSEKAEHRKGALQSLIDFKIEKCAGRIAELYDREQDKGVKDKAFEYLRTIGKPAEPFLLKLMGSSEAPVRKGALEGLRKTPGDEVLVAVGKLYVAETDGAVLNEAFEYLRAAGDAAEPHFLAGLRSGQGPVRLKSIEGLRNLKNSKALEPIAEVFRADASDAVRKEAKEFLVAQGLKAEGALVEALSAEDPKVKHLAIQALGEIQSEKPLGKIAGLFREDKDGREVHRIAFEYLKRLGARAEKDLLFAVDDGDKAVRREAIEALGNAKSEAAIGKLIDVVGEIESDATMAAIEALVRIGPKAVEATQQASKGDARMKRAAEKILAFYYKEEVERILDKLITPQGRSGYYPGMFQDLDKFGRDKALPVLLEMVRMGSYQIRIAEWREGTSDYDRARLMRQMAIMSLAELGDSSSIDALQEALKESSENPLASVREEVVVALHRLGEKKPLEEYAQKTAVGGETLLKGDNKIEGCKAFFALGIILNRVGRRDEAEAAYQKVVETVEKQNPPLVFEDLPSALYNLACLKALKGDKAMSVETLRKAVEAGFKDKEWIERDKDLDGLRSEESYKKLLADEALFKKKPE